MTVMNNCGVYIKIGKGCSQNINNSGTGKLICEKCFNISDMGIEYSFNNIYTIQKVGNLQRGIHISGQTIPDISAECDCCGEITKHFVCDDEMADIISILNKKGYKTRYCCAGHDLRDQTYIMFDKVYELEDIHHSFLTISNVKDELNNDVTLLEYIPNDDEENELLLENSRYIFFMMLREYVKSVLPDLNKANSNNMESKIKSNDSVLHSPIISKNNIVKDSIPHSVDSEHCDRADNRNDSIKNNNSGCFRCGGKCNTYNESSENIASSNNKQEERNSVHSIEDAIAAASKILIEDMMGILHEDKETSTLLNRRYVEYASTNFPDNCFGGNMRSFSEHEAIRYNNALDKIYEPLDISTDVINYIRSEIMNRINNLTF